MLKNYLKIALRDLARHKILASINMLSLSIGLACFSLFLLYAVHEFNYDRFHADSERLFRVYRWSEKIADRGTEGDPYLPIPLAPALESDFPDIENAVRMREPWGKNFVRAGGKVQRLGISFADSDFFEVFNFPLKYGDRATALKTLDGIVLTEKTALQIFGESNPIGRSLEIKLLENFETFTVAAVAEDLPSNSTIRFDALGSFEKLLTTPHAAKRRENWGHSAYHTFVKLRAGSGLATDSHRLLDFRKKYYPNEEAILREKGFWKGEGAPVTYRMQPLPAMHTHTLVGGGDVPPVEPRQIWLLLGIAAGLLVIACINFTTLAIGRSAGRAREVGVRKVMGSGRQQLVGQFLTESLLLAVVSAGFGGLLAQALLPFFNELSDRELAFSFKKFPEMAWLLGATVVLTGLLAGSYPALSLSKFRPVEILKSKIRLGGSNFFTKSLVAGQFVLAIGLMASTFVILRQIDFMRSKNPGFDRENVVVVDASDTDSERIFPIFKEKISALPQVAGVASSELGLGAGMGWSRSGWSQEGKHHEVFEYFVDGDFLQTLGIQLIAGRNFEKGRSADTLTSVILNESALRDFGWTAETALGQTLIGYHDDPKKELPKVIGVVRDFHFRPLSEAVAPQMFHQFSDYAPFKFFVRLRPGDPAPALAALQKSWAETESVLPFKYSFLDEDLDRFYKSESRLGEIVAWAGGISIFLACLGLFGLAALAVANRVKEIGIRKVLGATAASVANLLVGDFLKLVVVAVVIASPLAYFFMKNWLSDFAYRIDLEWWMFASAGAAAVAVAALTVGFQSVRAALANPVQSLRSE